MADVGLGRGRAVLKLGGGRALQQNHSGRIPPSETKHFRPSGIKSWEQEAQFLLVGH